MEMKAIVCDKCGKVVLQPDYTEFSQPEGINILRYWDKEDNGAKFNRNIKQIELCEECTDELREKLKQEKPWAVNYGFGGGCCGCPPGWGYEEFAPDFCVGGNTDGRCSLCWDRVIPGMEPDNKEGAGGLRPCEVDGRRGWFHRFVEEERGLLQIDCFMKPESVERARRTFEETGVIPGGCSMEKIRHAWALVEFSDGTVKKVEPETVHFIDGEGKA